MRNKFVIFNYPDTKGWKRDNPDGYYYICLEDLHRLNDVDVVNYPLEGRSLWLKILHRVISSLKIRSNNNVIFNCLLGCFYPLYFHNQVVKDYDSLCFVFISDVWDIGFIRYLKKTYPQGKIIMALRDLVKTKWFYKELQTTGLIDKWMSYDHGDCEKYGMTYFSEFESKIKILEKSNVPKSDVFFTGRAKQRLPVLVECYDYLTSMGLKCLFIILDAPEDQKVFRDGIKYTNTYMSYRRMLEYSICSKCLLDINQEGATGYTSRFLEAVIYNKLLLTNTSGISEHPLYDKRYIKEFKNIKEVEPTFFECSEVEYNYNNEFSPLYFLEKVKRILNIQ